MDKRTAEDIKKLKLNGEKIVMVTCYDATMAKILSKSDTDMLLVGDSVGMTKLGYKDTLPVTMEDMIHHTKAVANGTDKEKVVLVTDMPYKSYEDNPKLAVENAKKLISSGADMVKLEGGVEIIESIKAIINEGIKIVGHLGLMPQSIEKMGGYKVQCKDEQSQKKLLEDALLLEKEGVSLIVLEGIPEQVAKMVTDKLSIPTIGIGAGKYCDGQVLVSDDMLGMFTDFTPKFVKKYANLAETIQNAAKQYSYEVKNNIFPEEGNTYK
ncbi:3-methyl-2-oxobutanoate hydroxymethyltransferase [Candidatus Ruminimicrobium bovinum]|uniref:3-methyl-2-oxobutanoate hydroxymethyltransferase n=1 Tax=Candidatus Ruminimicrobium bovinum TaxID=3242779 RepID=UPI0039B9BA73